MPNDVDDGFNPTRVLLKPGTALVLLADAWGLQPHKGSAETVTAST
jgi:hypothetical protein